MSIESAKPIIHKALVRAPASGVKPNRAHDAVCHYRENVNPRMMGAGSRHAIQAEAVHDFLKL